MKVHGGHSHHGNQASHASETARKHANEHSAVRRSAKSEKKDKKGLEAELQSLIQQLQAFEKKFFGDSFDSGGSSATGAANGNPGVVGPTSGGGGGVSSAGGGDVGGVSSAGGVGASGGVDGSGGVSGVDPSSVGPGVSGITCDDPRLQQALDMIYSDPDGKKLIDAAKAQGLTQIVTNKGLNPDGGAGTQGETFSGPDGQRIEIADPSSPNLIQTLAHELGHAATPGDGDSQTEEATVDALGNAIQQRLIGRTAGDQLDASAYSNLPVDNGIALDLRQLGIIVP